MNMRQTAELALPLYICNASEMIDAVGILNTGKEMDVYGKFSYFFHL